jgi:hypothetical protein
VVGSFSPRRHGGHGENKEEIRKEDQEGRSGRKIKKEDQEGRSRRKIKKEAKKESRKRECEPDDCLCFSFYVFLPCSPCFRGEYALGN